MTVIYKFDLNAKFLMIYFISMIPIGLDAGGQLIGLWESTNVSRIITGSIVGMVMGISIGVIIEEIKKIISEKKIPLK